MKVSQALGGAAPQAQPAAPTPAPAAAATPAAPAPTPAPAPAASPSSASRVGSAVARGAKAVGSAAVKGAKAVGGAVAGAASGTAPAPAPAPAVPKVGAKQAKAQIDQAVNNIQGIRTRDRANVVNYAKQKVNALTESAMLNDIKKLAGLK
jgi:hypothetical protein